MSSRTRNSINRIVGRNTSIQPIGSVTFAVAAGTTNVSNVTISVRNGRGSLIAEPRTLDVYLSDAATGAGLTAATASGTVQAASGGGTVIGTYTAKKALKVQTKTDGTFVLEITDSAKTGFYVIVVDPATGKNYVSSQLVTANYG